MSIHQVSRKTFESLNIARTGYTSEQFWFMSSTIDIAGTVIRDSIDKDWVYVVLAKDNDEVFRYISSEVNISSSDEARNKLRIVMGDIEERGVFEEKFYEEETELSLEDSGIVISSIDDGIKKYFKLNPEKLYDIAPRKFEELVASILVDLGFDVEITKATRDGGTDIIAYVRNAVCSYLTHIECKRYAPNKKVGVGIIREVIGVHQIRKATKSIIVTTSFFSHDALKEAELMENQLDLKDFNDLKKWLQKY
jgi:hypothetical protein